MADIEEHISEEIEFLETALEGRRAERAELLPAVKELKAKRDEMEAVLRQVREAYLAVENQFLEKHKRLSKIDDEGKKEKDRLEALKRERDRLLDAKEVNAKYLAQVEEFKNRCLEAVWRKENRNDGFGAKQYQIDGAVHLAITERVLLGDKRGLGKTLTSLITTDLTDAEKVIVLVPADVANNWVREARLWAPHRTPIKLTGMSKGQRDNVLNVLKKVPNYLLLVNYEMWRDDFGIINQLVDLRADTLIADESHNIMTNNSLQNQGVQGIVYGINACPVCCVPKLDKPVGWNKPYHEEYKCWCGHVGPLSDFCSIKRVYPMTGTSILNKPQEIFPQLRLVDIANFNNPRYFLLDFCRKDEDGHWQWRDEHAQKDLVKAIGPRYYARTREMVGEVIPPNQEIIHDISMEELKVSHYDQWDAYQQIHEAAEIVLNPEFAMPMPNRVTALMRLRQVLVWPAAIHSEFKYTDENGRERMKTVHLEVQQSWKLDLLEEEIRKANEDGERCVVFSQFRDGLHELGRRLGPRTALYDGTVKERVRNAIQLDFDAKTAPAHPTWDNVLGNYKSAGTGLNFNAASQLYLPDREWNPGKEDQAIGRLDRLGQTRDTYTHKLMVGSSVDIWMDEILDMKAQMIGGFVSEAQLMQSAWDKLKNGEM